MTLRTNTIPGPHKFLLPLISLSVKTGPEPMPI